jgi:hypothetical protein
VLAQVATLQEIDKHYTLADILDANEMLDWKSALESEQLEKSKGDQKWRR